MSRRAPRRATPAARALLAAWPPGAGWYARKGLAEVLAGTGHTRDVDAVLGEMRRLSWVVRDRPGQVWALTPLGMIARHTGGLDRVTWPT